MCLVSGEATTECWLFEWMENFLTLFHAFYSFSKLKYLCDLLFISSEDIVSSEQLLLSLFLVITAGYLYHLR